MTPVSVAAKVQMSAWSADVKVCAIAYKLSLTRENIVSFYVLIFDSCNAAFVVGDVVDNEILWLLSLAFEPLDSQIVCLP